MIKTEIMNHILINTKFYFIQSLGENYLKKCLESFDNTCNQNHLIDKIILKELCGVYE